jgi:hypothetical protein
METTRFEKVFGGLFSTHVRSRPKQPELRRLVRELTSDYIDQLNSSPLSPDEVRQELCSIFKYVHDECEIYGRNKPRIRMKVLNILNALSSGMNSNKGERLVRKWKSWEDMLNPASLSYIGIDLPGSMILEGYLVFEDLIPIREYFEKKYIDGSFIRNHVRS